MITNIVSPGMLSGMLFPDRIKETLIGAAAAVLATFIFPTRGLAPTIRGQLRGTARAIDQVIKHLERGSARGTASARRACGLIFELNITGWAVRRAEAEVPGA